MNTGVAVATIIAGAVVKLAFIGAGVRLARPLLPRLQVTNPRGRAQPAAGTGQPAAAGADGQKATTP